MKFSHGEFKKRKYNLHEIKNLGFKIFKKEFCGSIENLSNCCHSFGNRHNRKLYTKQLNKTTFLVFRFDKGTKI